MPITRPRRFSTSTDKETNPLLPKHVQNYATIPQFPSEQQTPADSDAEDEAVANDEVAIHTTPAREAKLLFKHTLPLTLTYLLQYSFSLITTIVVGHIGTTELAAVSLATMTANITGMAIYEGLATSLDTLCAQAYGSHHKSHVGLHLQRMSLLMLLITIPIGILWFFSGPLLALLVPASEQHIAHLAGRYLRLLFLGCPGYALFEAGKRFTQAQGRFTASLYVLLVAVPVNVALNYLLVFHLDLGLTGAALAVAASNTLLPLLLLLYILAHPATHACWPGLTRLACHHWGTMLHLALPGIVMVEAEWLAFDLLTFATTRLSPAHLAAQSILTAASDTVFHLPFSGSIAASTRLGTLVGAGRPALPAARTAARTHALLFVALGAGDALLLGGLAGLLPGIFTPDPTVRRLATATMPLLAAFQFVDATTALANGVLRALGRQAVGGVLNVAVYYLFAVPLALALCFGCGMGLPGLWLGVAVGSLGITIAEGLYVKWMRWERAVDEVMGREAEDPDEEVCR